MIEAFNGLSNAWNVSAALFLTLMIGALVVDAYRAWRERKEQSDE